MSTISIITPIYNSAEYLDRCLKSLVSQTFGDIELVWIDNGATLECKQIIKKYLNNKVKLLVYENNIGYFNAIIEGIKSSSSQYIGFCDSDDWVDNNYYEILFKNLNDNNCEMIICPFVYCYDNLKKNRVQKLFFYGITSKYDSVFNSLSNGCIWNCLFHKKLLDTNVLERLNITDSNFVDNVILVYGVLKSKKTLLCDCTLYNYYQRKNSTISKLTKKQMELSCGYIVRLVEKIVDENFKNIDMQSLAYFLQRSIPVHTIKSKSLCQNKIFKSQDNLLKFISLCSKYYYPNFIDRLFSVSINKTTSKLRIRFCFITLTKRLK